MAPETIITLYGRPQCCLCEEAEAVIRHALRGHDATLQTVDITGDSHLEAAYGQLIPVTAINGEVVFYGKVSALRLRRLLGGGSLSQRYQAFLASFPARFRR